MGKGLVRRFIAGLAAMLLLLWLMPLAMAEENAYDANHPESLAAQHLDCLAAILIEAETGDVIFEKNADTLLYPASTTKIMTALLAIMMGDLDATATASATAVAMPEDASTLGLLEGEQMSLRDLLYGTMLTSGNDGAMAIAETVAGSVDAFVNLMNTAAANFGCTGTHFANPHGYQDGNHYSTARDLSTIARVAMGYDVFRDIVAQTSYTIPRTNLNAARKVYLAQNWFMEQSENHATCYYPYGTGIKTGSTSDAGYCYVGSATRDGISLISVVLRCSSREARFLDTIKLMEYGFSQYMSTSIAEIYSMNPKVIDIMGFDLDDPNVGKLTLNLQRAQGTAGDTIMTTRDNLEYWVQNLSDVTVTEFTREFNAPITAGEVMGTLSYYATPNAEPIVYQLVASRSIARREGLAPTLQEIIDSTNADPNPLPRFSFELLFLYVFLPALGIFLFWKGVRFAFGRLKKKSKVKAMRPTERYYR